MKAFELLFDSVTKSGLAPALRISLMKATPASSTVTMMTACGSDFTIAATASSTLTVPRAWLPRPHREEIPARRVVHRHRAGRGTDERHLGLLEHRIGRLLGGRAAREEQREDLLLVDQLLDHLGRALRVEPVIERLEHDLAAVHTAGRVHPVEVGLGARGELLHRARHRAGEARRLPENDLGRRHSGSAIAPRIDYSACPGQGLAEEFALGANSRALATRSDRRCLLSLGRR